MFELNRAQRDIQKAARDFARGEFDKDQALEMETGEVFPEQIWRKAGELGFLGLHFPEQYGGSGLSLFETVLVTEVFCRQDSSIGSALALAGCGAECLLHFGSEALKNEFLPAVIEGHARSALAYAEPDGRSDASVWQTRLASENGEWIVDGTKTHVLNGGSAQFYFVTGVTEEKEPGMVLIEADQPGVVTRSQGRRLGFNMLASADLALQAVHVPEGRFIGERGRGAAQLERCLDEARIVAAGAALGVAAGAFDRALAYVKEREAFGRKLAGFETVQDKIAAMTVKIEATRPLVYSAAIRQSAGNAGILPATARMTAARTALEAADEAIQLFGGYGYMKETEVERFYRDAKMIQLLFGGEAAARKKIAAAVIGKMK
jgi:alkylation response protein AidB-like acyl-CoA dehydrogenase